MTAISAPAEDRTLIVGASLAGLRSAEALGKTGYAGQIIVVGNEHHEPYNRPPLSKRIAEVTAAPAALTRHRSIRDVTWRLGTSVTASDLAARTVTLDSGEVLSWRGLVIASGLRPRRLRIQGPPTGPLQLRTFDDAVALGRALGSARSVVVVGGGFVGCEVAATAAALGVRTHLVAPEPQPLLRPLGEMVAQELRRRLEQLGITFHLGCVPVHYLGEERASGVALSNLEHVKAEFVIEAVGSVPNTEWLSGNDLDLRDGVITDQHLRVAGHPGVFACGDIARFPHPAYDDVPRRLEHWTVAVDTARQAGANLGNELLGRPVGAGVARLVPSFWSHLAGIRLQSFGLPMLGMGDVRILEGDLRTDAAIGYHLDDRLVGVVLIGMADRHVHYQREIERLGTHLVSR